MQICNNNNNTFNLVFELKYFYENLHLKKEMLFLHFL